MSLKGIGNCVRFCFRTQRDMEWNKGVPIFCWLLRLMFTKLHSLNIIAYYYYYYCPYYNTAWDLGKPSKTNIPSFISLLLSIITQSWSFLDPSLIGSKMEQTDPPNSIYIQLNNNDFQNWWVDFGLFFLGPKTHHYYGACPIIKDPSALLRHI